MSTLHFAHEHAFAGALPPLLRPRTALAALMALWALCVAAALLWKAVAAASLWHVLAYLTNLTWLVSGLFAALVLPWLAGGPAVGARLRRAANLALLPTAWALTLAVAPLAALMVWAMRWQLFVEGTGLADGEPPGAVLLAHLLFHVWFFLPPAFYVAVTLRTLGADLVWVADRARLALEPEFVGGTGQLDARWAARWWRAGALLWLALGVAPPMLLVTVWMLLVDVRAIYGAQALAWWPGEVALWFALLALVALAAAPLFLWALAAELGERKREPQCEE